MRILLVSDYDPDPRLGSPKVAFELQREFRDLGHVCEALFRPDLGIWPRNTRLRELASPALAWRAAARAFRKYGPFDIIDAASAEGFVIGLARRAGQFRNAALVARSNGLEHTHYRRLIEDHDAGHFYKPPLRRVWHPLARLPQVEGAIRLADAVIMLNPEGRAVALARGWQPSDRIEIIPHGISPAIFDAVAPLDEPPRGGGILYVGAWNTSKGIFYLVEAHAALLRQGIRIPLTVLGPGIPEADVRADFAPASQPLLTVLPRLDEAAVVREFRRHDMLACPSTMEAFGLVVIEAMSQRLPVVCTAAVGAAAMFTDRREALILPPRDLPALVEALAELWRDPRLRRSLADAAAPAVAGMTWRRTARLTLEAYERALARRPV